MQLLHQIHQMEYRDRSGHDRAINVDIWSCAQRKKIVLIMHDLPQPPHNLEEGGKEQALKLMHAQAWSALQSLHHSLLPYLLHPDSEMTLFAMQAHQEGEDAKLVALPLSA